MTNTPKSEEYSKIVDLSLQVLTDYEMFDFPLDIKKLANKMGIKLKKYSTLSTKQYMLLSSKSELGITVVNTFNENHLTFETFYNDVDCNIKRNRFTIAHEIGHISNGDIGKNSTKKDEILYDYFAKCLLAPQCLIILNREFDVNTIVTNYNVSKQVAEIWLQAILNRISTYGCNYFKDTEKDFLKKQKKYHNQQPASTRL